MKAILKFDLSDPDQKQEHLRCVKALDIALALYDITGIMKKVEDNEDHYGRAMTAKQLKDFISRSIIEVLEDNRINLEDLVQ